MDNLKQTIGHHATPKIVKEFIYLIIFNADKFCFKNHDAIPKGDSLNIVETEYVLCKKK